jgi:hypothetical protein
MVVIGVGVLSAARMALLFHPSGDPTRVYYGTDTRLFDLMAGATVAFLAAGHPQPGLRARRTLHMVAPAAAALLGVFWVVSGTSAGLPRDWMFRGGFLVCAVLAALVVADVRLLDPGPLSRLLSLRPLHFLGTISYGIYLWHWPIFVYLTGARTGLSSVPLDVVRIALTLGVSTASFYLVEQPLRRAHLRGALRLWLAPLAGIAAAILLVVATTPAIADPDPVAHASRLNTKGTAVAGSGGYQKEKLIKLPKGTVISPSHPLRVTIIGDSVMHDASFGITAALQATGEATVHTNTIDGFGLTTATNWPMSFPTIIRETQAQLIVASWSWDQDGPTTPNALHQPKAYTALLERAIRVILTPGDGVIGIVFTQFPISGNIPAANPANQKVYNAARLKGVAAWNDIAAEMPALFPGRVMYLPLADSILLHGRFSSWLPPVGDPKAPSSEWIRVRKVDNVHLCPEGAARYADALLSDLTAILSLAPAGTSWTDGSWTTNPDFNNPPGACPDDHPPGGLPSR